MGRLVKYLNNVSNSSNTSTTSNTTSSSTTTSDDDLVSSKYDLVEAKTELDKALAKHRETSTTATVVKGVYESISPDVLLGLEECDVGKTLAILNTNLKVLGVSGYESLHTDLVGYEGILDTTISGVKKFLKMIGEAIKAIIDYIVNLVKKFVNYVKKVFSKNKKSPDEQVKESMDKAKEKAEKEQKDLDKEFEDLVENPTKEMLTTKEKVLWQIPMLVYMVEGINDHNLDDITEAITEASRKFASRFNKDMLGFLAPKNTIEFFSRDKAIDRIIASIRSEDMDIFNLAYATGELLLKDMKTYSKFPSALNTSYISPVLNKVVKDIIRTIRGFKPTDKILITAINGEYISYLHITADLEELKASMEQFEDKVTNTTLETTEDAANYIKSVIEDAKEIVKKIIVAPGRFTVDDLKALNIPIERYIEDTEIPVASVINEAEIKLRVFKELMDENKTGLKDMEKFQTELKVLKNKYKLVNDLIKNYLDTSNINAKKIVSAWQSYSELVLHELSILENVTITYVDFYKSEVEVGNKLARYVKILSDYYIKLT